MSQLGSNQENRVTSAFKVDVALVYRWDSNQEDGGVTLRLELAEAATTHKLWQREQMGLWEPGKLARMEKATWAYRVGAGKREAQLRMDMVMVRQRERWRNALDSPLSLPPISSCLPLTKLVQQLSDTWVRKTISGPLKYRAEQGDEGKVE